VILASPNVGTNGTISGNFQFQSPQVLPLVRCCSEMQPAIDRRLRRHVD